MTAAPFSEVDPDRIAATAYRIVALLAACTNAETLAAIACAVSIRLDACSPRERTHVAHMLADTIIAAGELAERTGHDS